jgi:osmoprotectant transport system permease protein
MIDWGWLAGHAGSIASRTAQHVELAAIALVIGFGVSFLLALWSVSRPRAYPLIASLSGVVYSIPSLALFVAFVPLTGLSLLTVEIPLVLYTFVIYVRNIVAGLRSVPPDVAEAADAMGHTRLQRLRQVELPLAIPLIVAGVRLASVSTIGLVTITITVGDAFGGLGFFILERPFFVTEVLVGALGSIALAVLADVGFAWLERRLTPWTRGPVARGA